MQNSCLDLADMKCMLQLARTAASDKLLQ